MTGLFHTVESTPPPLPRSGFWTKNWKWMVPVAAVVAFAGFVALIVSVVFGVIKSTEPYKEAVSRASADTAVQSALGTPVKSDFLVTGSINTAGSHGRALLDIPISGPKGKAHIHVEAIKDDGKWTYTHLDVTVPGMPRTIPLPR